MVSFLKLIRLPNLLVIAFTQYMIRWCLIHPVLERRGLELQLSQLNFFLVVLATVMIAAAGYIINDYFDLRIDRVNKPDRIQVGKGVKRRVAMGAHTVINILAITISFYVSYKIGLWKVSIIYFMAATGLWFYSTTFKRQFLIGNFIIAIFTGLVPLIVGIFELIPTYAKYLPQEPRISFKEIWIYIFAISFFAFITTLLREIIKDIEDYEGDKEYGCDTLPIVLGKSNAKIVASFVALLIMISLAYVQYMFWLADDKSSFHYFLFALQVPFAFLVYKISTALTKKEYRFAGNATKGIMLIGICYLFLFSYILNH